MSVIDIHALLSHQKKSYFGFLLFLLSIVLIVRSSVFLNNHIPDQNLGKYEDFDYIVPDDVFSTTDNSRTEIEMIENDWLISSFSEPTIESRYWSVSPSTPIQCGDDERYVYVAAYEDFLVIDVQDPERPTIIGSCLVGVKIDEFVIDGDFAYVSCYDDKKLYVLDIEEKTNPTILNLLGEGHAHVAINVRDDFIFTGVYESFLIIDISDKSNPIILGNETIGHTDDWNFIFLEGNYAYVGFSNSLYILDISNFDIPFRVTSYGCENTILSFDIKDDYGYVTIWDIGLYIIDISDKSNPTNISLFSCCDESDSKIISTQIFKGENDEEETYFFLSTLDFGIQLYNITKNVFEPILIGTFFTSAYSDVEIYSFCSHQNTIKMSYGDDNNQLILFSNEYGLITIDYSSLLNPQLISNEFGWINPYQFETDGNNYIFVDSVLNGYSSLKIISLEDNTHPRTISTTRTYTKLEDNIGGRRSGISKEGDFVYFCANDSMHIFNVSDVTNPQLISNVYLKDGCWNMKAVGDSFVYTVQFQFEIDSRFSIIDVSDKNHPKVVGERVSFFDDSEEAAGYFHVDVSGDYAFIAAESSLDILDISNKSNPFLVSNLSSIYKQSFCLKVDGDFVYFCEGSLGIRVVDISDIFNPKVTGSCDASATFDISLDGDYLYVADGSGGTKIINVQDKTKPVVVDTIPCYSDIYQIESVFAKNKNLIVGDDHNRIHMYRSKLRIFGNSIFPSFCGETEVTVKASTILSYPSSSSSSTAEDYFTIYKEDFCNTHGECLLDYSCFCDIGYEGDHCDGWKCGIYDLTNFGKVCSGHGNCIAPQECECEDTWIGEDCGGNVLYGSLLYPGIGLLCISIMICLCFTCCMICVCCYCALLLICFCLASCSFIYFRQTKSLKKFNKLDNFDLFLEEQELEKDTSLAHIKIDKSLFEILNDEIELIEILGEGGSLSVVYKAKWKSQLVAYKCFKTRNVCDSQNSFDQFEKEVHIMASVKHPNVLRFFGCCLSPPRIGIITEFCVNGDLHLFLRKKFSVEGSNSSGYPLGEKIRFCREICSAMEYLHSRDIIHRDLKLENVLVDGNENSKLTDFGLSKFGKNIGQQMTQKVGTNYFMAPELVLSPQYDEKIDVFSFSIMLYMIISENFLPYGKKSINVELQVANNPEMRPKLLDMMKKLPSSPKSFNWIIDVVKKCWDHDPTTRHSFSELSVIIQEKCSSEEGGLSRDSSRDDEGERERNSEKQRLLEEEERRGETLRMEIVILEQEKKKLIDEFGVMRVI